MKLKLTFCFFICISIIFFFSNCEEIKKEDQKAIEVKKSNDEDASKEFIHKEILDDDQKEQVEKYKRDYSNDTEVGKEKVKEAKKAHLEFLEKEKKRREEHIIKKQASERKNLDSNNLNQLSSQKEYITISTNENVTDASKKINIKSDVLKNLIYLKEINLAKFSLGDSDEILKIANYNFENPSFTQKYYGECWDTRPKSFSELDYYEINRTAFVEINDKDISLLKILKLLDFKFNKKNRIYVSEASIDGKHLCNNKIYEYSISIFVVYKVKLKKYDVVLSSLKDLSANIKAKKITASYAFKTKGVQVNHEFKGTRNFSTTESGLFSDAIKLSIDKKINYFLEEISKEDGAFIGRPYPKNFKWYTKE